LWFAVAYSYLISFIALKIALTTVPSPCINWCDINPENGYCRGCYRTLTEIANWSELPNDDKLKIWEAITARKLQVKE
jgi:predicted Fe-S protein YdhL (DUF1289 family)